MSPLKLYFNEYGVGLGPILLLCSLYLLMCGRLSCLAYQSAFKRT